MRPNCEQPQALSSDSPKHFTCTMADICVSFRMPEWNIQYLGLGFLPDRKALGTGCSLSLGSVL